MSKKNLDPSHHPGLQISAKVKDEEHNNQNYEKENSQAQHELALWISSTSPAGLGTLNSCSGGFEIAFLES